MPVRRLGARLGEVGDVVLLGEGRGEIVNGLVPVPGSELVEDALVEGALEQLLHLGAAKGGGVVVEQMLEVVQAGGQVGFGRHGLLVVLDLELVRGFLKLAPDGILRGLQLRRHLLLENLHQLLPQRHSAGVDMGLGAKQVGVLAKKGLLVPRDGGKHVARVPLKEPGLYGQLGDDTDIAQSERVHLVVQDGRPLFRIHQVHLGDDTNCPLSPGVDPPARLQSSRVCQVRVRGRNGQNNVGSSYVLVAELRDLALQLPRLVLSSHLDIPGEVDQREVWYSWRVDDEVDRVVRDTLGVGDGLVQLGEVFLDEGKVGDPVEAQVGELAIVDPGLGIVDEGELDGPTSDHVAPLGKKLVAHDGLQHRALSRRLGSDNDNRGEGDGVCLADLLQEVPDFDHHLGDVHHVVVLGDLFGGSVVLLRRLVIAICRCGCACDGGRADFALLRGFGSLVATAISPARLGFLGDEVGEPFGQLHLALGVVPSALRLLGDFARAPPQGGGGGCDGRLHVSKHFLGRVADLYELLARQSSLPKFEERGYPTDGLVLHPCHTAHHQPTKEGGNAGKLDDELGQHACKRGVADDDGIVVGVGGEPPGAAEGAGAGAGARLDAAGGQLMEMAEARHASDDGGRGPRGTELGAHDGAEGVVSRLGGMLFDARRDGGDGRRLGSSFVGVGVGSGDFLDMDFVSSPSMPSFTMPSSPPERQGVGRAAPTPLNDLQVSATTPQLGRGVLYVR